MGRPLSVPAWRRSLAVPALLAVLGLVFLAPAVAFSAPLTSVFVNGVRVSAYPVVDSNGVSYLPINAMAEALQASITYDARLRIIKVNGDVVGASPYFVDGKVYLPVEAFADALGGSVTYDGREKAIRVDTTPGAAAVASTGTQAPVAARTTVPVTAPPVTVAAPTSYQTPTYTTTPSPYSTPAPSYSTPAPSYTTAPIPPASTYPVTTTGGYPTNTTQPGYPVQYTPNPSAPSANPRPVDAPPSLGSNFQTGPVIGAQDPTQGNVAYAPMPSYAQRPTNDGPYVPHSAQNSIFQVTVTNLETVEVIKDFYRPRTGYKFVVVYLSQQNVSEEVQIYTGRFSLLDQANKSYDYLEGLSNFWLVILRPFGINFGYLVFEVPVDARPMSLVLHALNQAPLTLNL